MAQGSGAPTNAVPLADDPVGVDRETKPRNLQRNGGSLVTTVDPTWLRQLGIDSRGSSVYHSLSLGRVPIIVTEPAIIIQPAHIIQKNDD